jgi:hypothetical protein
MIRLLLHIFSYLWISVELLTLPSTLLALACLYQFYPPGGGGGLVCLPPLANI